jgi:hypothetical protein
MILDINLLNSRRFDFTVLPPPEIKLLTIRNNLILSRSNFCILTGLPKVGKSTFTSAVIASAFNHSEVFDIKLSRHKDKPKIAWFDTEQSQYDLYKSVARTLQLANISTIPKDLDIFTFRKDEANGILKLIEYYLINNPKTGTIIIDGLLDLVYNFNDERECKILIDYLKRITAEYNIGIIAVLHTGKTTGATVGHIGSFADRYCQSNLEISKCTQQVNTINLKPKLLRSAPDFEPISLMRNDENIIFQVMYQEPPTVIKR